MLKDDSVPFSTKSNLQCFLPSCLNCNLKVLCPIVWNKIKGQLGFKTLSVDFFHTHPIYAQIFSSQPHPHFDFPPMIYVCQRRHIAKLSRELKLLFHKRYLCTRKKFLWRNFYSLFSFSKRIFFGEEMWWINFERFPRTSECL